jgi:hypothetical protein
LILARLFARAKNPVCISDTHLATRAHADLNFNDSRMLAIFIGGIPACGWREKISSILVTAVWILKIGATKVSFHFFLCLRTLNQYTRTKKLWLTKLPTQTTVFSLFMDTLTRPAIPERAHEILITVQGGAFSPILTCREHGKVVA